MISQKNFKMKKKIILITGVAGMIGSELLTRYIYNKKNIIIGLDNFTLGKKKNINKFLKKKNFIFFNINLSNKIKNKKLNKFLKNKKIDDVWHLAANSDIKNGIINSEVDYKNTFLTTYHILNFVKNKLKNNSKFIFTSSSAVFGDVKKTISENMPALYSCSNYGSMKLASEAIISSFSFLNNIKSFVFRLPNVVGKNLTHGVVFDLANKIKNKKIKHLQVLGNGKQCKPYSHGSEIVDCMIYIKDKTQKDFVNYFNIGNNDKGVKVEEIVNLLIKKFDFKKKIKFEKKNFGWKGDVPKYSYSTKKINKLGYRFNLSSLDAIRKTIDELRK